MRGLVARLFFVLALALQAFFLVRGYWDPHKHFAFQPFNESSEWRADIDRVTVDGRRVSARTSWSGYRWHELVRDRGLGHPFRMHHADTGIDSTMVFLRHALDWVADHTPRDRETLYYEARVTYFRNQRGPYQLTMTSKRRQVAP
jgi:hypothetical protein